MHEEARREHPLGGAPAADALGAAAHLLAGPGRRERVLHEHTSPARTGTTAAWPGWVHPALRASLEASGVSSLWEHQVRAAEAARAGRHVVVSTGTASGKSLAYLLPALTAVAEGAAEPGGPASSRATSLYLSPTKALAADQLQVVRRLAVPGVRAATYDGDVPPEERRWVRDHANHVLTNPDMLHRSLLPGHPRWQRFLRALRVVVVDECHHYRGLFGSHVANVLRRLRRLALAAGADPVFVLASATAAEPALTASRLIGVPASHIVAVTEDTARRGATRFWMWEPPLLPGTGEKGAPTRRSATAEAADLLTDLVAGGVRTVAFTRSRRGAEAVAATARRALAEVDPALPGRVAAYRSGFLPEERRELERRLRAGDLLGVASTSALELGVDVSGLDAVVVAGWPGTRSALWQRAGRAGRSGTDALAVFVAEDDPLDTYVVHHPEVVLGAPVESTVLDPGNPYVLGPHLCAAAAERPLTTDDLPLFGSAAEPVLRHLVAGGLLRRRPGGWFWTRRERAADLADLRGAGGEPVRLVEATTGRVLGTVDAGSAHHTVHPGAVYVHQGETHVVEALDEEGSVALLHREEVDHTTSARTTTDVRILAEQQRRDWGPVAVCSGAVEVTTQVTSYLRRRATTGQVLGEEPLDLPARTLRTAAVWWTVPPDLLEEAGVTAADLPGAAHAAEHAAIGLLPLVATCDRWDVGGVSTALHPDTGLPTVVVHDAAPGGAGFADRGFAAAATWLGATADLVAACECPAGCPSCVQSPKCGNGNEPLDKAGALRLLRLVLTHADDDAGAGSPSAAEAPLVVDLRDAPTDAPDALVQRAASADRD
ncbi:DEAD/DEAH box helicase domain-containing protein [Quadrisphaera granulorum]|uniref:DEAD/DEAH box helicase domain-containing protein n=1 Tax=Quadrisphaera granulorum TaxID=317664 RepID=A0A316A6K6_9ACTN|nr:DEAD/DEAH box helicase [Quadrisphaera granulorum]PWJ53335.1 DEAD/DEAH box helicase domain-containing protein [Quadrisphaera granulorum]SZE97009.1 DEAD/DEAH box helicase domain-containing protein [Quadrisphaera granulorum]